MKENPEKKWKSWKTMTLAEFKGGLGFRSILIIMESLRIKSAWNFLTFESLWATYLWSNTLNSCHWRLMILRPPPQDTRIKFGDVF